MRIRYSRYMSIRGIDASISIAWMFVVRNAPVIILRHHLFWSVAKAVAMADMPGALSWATVWMASLTSRLVTLTYSMFALPYVPAHFHDEMMETITDYVGNCISCLPPLHKLVLCKVLLGK
jgi:hypothetical protein